MDLKASILLLFKSPNLSIQELHEEGRDRVMWTGIEVLIARASGGQLVYAYISYYSNRFQDVGNECSPKCNSSNFDEL